MNSPATSNVRINTCFKLRRPLLVNGRCNRSDKSQSHISPCKDPSRDSRSSKSHHSRARSYFPEPELSQAQVSETKKRLSENSEKFISTKKKMAIDALLNPFVEANVGNTEPGKKIHMIISNNRPERMNPIVLRKSFRTKDIPNKCKTVTKPLVKAATFSGVPSVQQPIARTPPVSENAHLTFSESSENVQKHQSPEEIALVLASYMQNPLADIPMSPLLEDSFRPITLPPLSEERSNQGSNQSIAILDMDIEELMCSEDEIEGDSDSETTLTAPLIEDDLHSLLEDIMSMDEVLHILDMYDPEGFVTTSGIVPTDPENYPMAWNPDGWNEAGIFSYPASLSPKNWESQV